MKTFTILKSAAQSTPNLRTWGTTQTAYGNGRITRKEFAVIVRILSAAGLFTP
jgi:hypothetical protein